MRTSRVALGLILAGVGSLFVLHAPAAPEAPPAAGAVALQDLKYDDLGKLIRAQKNKKVVVVDFWADYCVPCKKAFPHLVAMHNKFDKDKVMVISVTVDARKDDPQEAAALRKKIVTFLEANKATMTNVWLDDSPSVWQDRINIDKIDAVPFMFVFDKSNKIVKVLFGDEYNPTVAENLVAELIKQ